MVAEHPVGKVLLTGRGTSGSWAIRGVQLGEALGATVKRNADLADCQAADVIVVVKRVRPETLAAIRASGKPWILDILDAYPQPLSDDWSPDEAIGWVRKYIGNLNPTAVIWPNQKMRDDCGEGLVLRHHHRPGIKRNPIREKVTLVGYEGSPRYLDRWRPIIDKQCSKRGWSFTDKPGELAELDIVLALRGQNSYVTRHWKSNVKLANAHASGTPFVGQPESGYVETACGCEYWAADATSLSVTFDWLVSQSAREQISDRFITCAYPVKQAAKDLREWIAKYS